MSSSYSCGPVKNFNITHILECGQCFRWWRLPDGSYDLAARGRRVNVRCEDRVLTITPCTKKEFETIWRDYFDLGTDYGRIRQILCEGDPVMRRAADYGWGIRILHQDLWETIVEFIISQNNNIPRIRGCIERLCSGFGEPIEDLSENREIRIPAAREKDEGDILTHNFPTAQKLASLKEEDLAGVRLGYRAGYLVKCAREILDRGMPKSREDLLALTGIGPKVASCIELFGLGRMDSFPIDVWVRRMMHELYGLDENDRKGMEAFARKKFGAYGGLAQQYLFYFRGQEK